MKDNHMKKGLVVSVILLFIGVAVAPASTSMFVKATNEDLVEVTTQACGIQGYENTTVKLSREQYQNLEQYLVEFRERLNQTSTREEAVPIFKEAVVELSKYGLLPKGMSVEQAQKLVIWKNRDNRIENTSFCLVTGSTTNSESFPVFYPFRKSILDKIYDFNNDLFMYIWAFSFMFLFIRKLVFPLYFFGELSFGYDKINSGHDYIPSTGWVYSLGNFGKKNWSGSFYGQIRKLQPYAFMPPTYIYYTGILGFTGLKIRLSDSNFLIGSCYKININQSLP